MGPRGRRHGLGNSRNLVTPPMTSRLASVLKNLFHRHRVEQDLDDELRSYIEMAAERGAAPESLITKRSAC